MQRPDVQERASLPEALEFDVMEKGTRYRMLANDFAIPRMEPGKQRPIESIDEGRHWERLFIGELKAGRDPRRTPEVEEPVDLDPGRRQPPTKCRSMHATRRQVSRRQLLQWKPVRWYAREDSNL